MSSISNRSALPTLIQPNSRWQNVIIALSIVIPVLVAVLIYLPVSARIADLNTRFLPYLNAWLNSATALALIISLIAIVNNNVRVHRMANSIAFGISALFLVSYVIYHYTTEPTPFGDSDFNGILSETEKTAIGSERVIYLMLLLSHIALATVVVPFVLFSMYYSLSGQFDKHKRLSRFTWPLWFYVSVSGVLVYYMIEPYYPPFM
jgi:putative membrane protein